MTRCKAPPQLPQAPPLASSGGRGNSCGAKAVGLVRLVGRFGLEKVGFYIGLSCLTGFRATKTCRTGCFAWICLPETKKNV